MPLADEEALVRESMRKVQTSERKERRMRMFQREASIAALLLCSVGMIGLMACVIGSFDLQVASSSEFEVTHVGGQSWALVRPSYDLTTLFAGLGMAGFAGSLIICGGVMGQFKKMPPGSAYAVGMSAFVSIVGILVLAVVG
jgi:hypothetical protein